MKGLQRLPVDAFSLRHHLACLGLEDLQRDSEARSAPIVTCRLRVLKSANRTPIWKLRKNKATVYSTRDPPGLALSSRGLLQGQALHGDSQPPSRTHTLILIMLENAFLAWSLLQPKRIPCSLAAAWQSLSMVGSCLLTQVSCT